MFAVTERREKLVRIGVIVAIDESKFLEGNVIMVRQATLAFWRSLKRDKLVLFLQISVGNLSDDAFLSAIEVWVLHRSTECQTALGHMIASGT